MRRTQKFPNGRFIVLRLASAACVALIIQGCSAEQSVPVEESATASNMGQDSGLEGIRVPDRANLTFSQPGTREYVVIASSIEDVTDFLAVALPPARDYRDWTFCRMSTRRDGERIVSQTREYVRGGRFVLIVEVSQFGLQDNPELALRVQNDSGNYCR